MTDVRIVQTESDARAHIVKLGMFFDGEGKSLCGRKPFPERWTIVYDKDGRKPVCVGCLERRRGK